MATPEFPHLHLHTTHSHLDGFGKVDDYYRVAQEKGMTALAHTEHGNISSWPSAQKAGQKYGVKPIFGIEAYIVKDNRVRERGYNHVTILAQNQTGIENLFSMVADSYNGGFFYKPRFDWKRLAARSDGLFILSGCWSGFASQHLIGSVIKNPTFDVKGKIPGWDEVTAWLKFMKKTFKGRFFMELMPIHSPLQMDLLTHELEIANKFKIPIIATNDCHYIHDGDDDTQDDLVCIRTLSKKTDPNRMRYDVRDLYLKTHAEVLQGFKDMGITKSVGQKAIANAFEVADACNAIVPQAPPVKFRLDPITGPATKMKKPKGNTTTDIFKAVIAFMWKERSFIPLTQKYKDRVIYELGIFTEKSYGDYLLIIWDVVWAAKTRSEAEGGPIFVGPARGSSSGSLICYILGITEIDPFYDNLIFERFVDPNRTDPPDIDIDFPDDERDWINAYLTKRWGGEKYVGHLMSHAIFKGKIALTDIARVYNVPNWALEKVKSSLIERSSGDARASFTIEDTIAEFPEVGDIIEKFPALKLASRLEGQIRHEGTHAAGIIVSTEQPLEEIGTFYRDNKFFMDKRDAEKFGYLKIDVLGLNTLTVLREAAKNIGLNGKEAIDFYYRMDMKDPETIEAFRRCDVASVFQFDGQAQMTVTRQLQPQTYEEVRDLTALSRPGPLHCGGFERYRKRARGEDIDWEIPDEIAPIVSDTFGVMIYQEQVMQVMRDLGRMTWAEIVDVRRHISKSVGVEHFEVFHNSFNKGAIDHHGLSPEVAQEIWDQMCTFGSWAFNKAHAAAYTRVSMWCMYMKVHHPESFLAAVAGYSSSEDKRARSVRLFQMAYGKVLSVDVNKSKKVFSLERDGEDALRPGLSDIKGIGEKAASVIVEQAPFSSFQDFLKRVPARLVNKKVRKILHAMGAFRAFDTEDVKKDRIALEVDAYIKSFGGTRKFASFHCFWVLPYDFKFMRKELKAKPLKTIVPRDEIRNNVPIVAMVRKINQRDYRELGSEEELKKLKPGEETKFINITVEDEEDFTMVTVPRRNYRRMKGVVFKSLSPGKVLYGIGNIPAGTRRVFLEKLYAVEEAIK